VSKEAMKQALEALEFFSDTSNSAMDKAVSEDAITSLRQAIAEVEKQEPVGWHFIEALYPQGERLDIRMGDGSILCNLLPQADGDLWWEGSGTGEKFIDPVYADVTHWRIHSNTHPQQRIWVGLTRDEIQDLLDIVDHYNYPQDLIVYTQAKLKEKNNG
jgi:hypothetical protein